MNKVELNKTNAIFVDHTINLQIDNSKEVWFSVSEQFSLVNLVVSSNVKSKVYLFNDSSSELIDFKIDIASNSNVELVVFNSLDIETNYNINLASNVDFKHFVIDLNNSSQCSIKTNLQAEYANYSLKTISLAMTNNIIDYSFEIAHLAKATTSNCVSRAIVDTLGKYTNKTVGQINNSFSKSICHQDTKALVLGDDAIAKCDPVLLIDEYDVEASHAAAVGQVNLDDLYYLQSRGLSYSECIKLLVYGFIIGELSLISNETVVEELQTKIDKVLTL